MEPAQIEVGEPFPQRLPRGQEGLFPLLADQTLLVPVVLSELRDADLRTFQRRKLQVGVVSVRSVPFACVCWEKWGCLDGSLNPYQYEEKYRRRFIEGEGNLLQLCVVEGPRHTVRHNRALGLDDEMYPFLREAYAECLETHGDEAEVNRAVGQVYQDFETPDELMRIAEHKQVFQR